MIRAVGFDLDGTLLDHRGAAGSAIEAWARDRGVEGAWASTWLALEDRWFPEYLAGRLGFQEQRRVRLRAFTEVSGLDIDDDALDSQFAGYLDLYQQFWSADPHALDLLVSLKGQGYALAVLTNGERDQQLAKLDALGLRDCVDLVLTLDDVPQGKPHPSAFNVLVDAVGGVPAEVAYVGDDLQADGYGAYAAGLLSLWLDRRGDQPSPAGPQRLTSLAQVPSYL